MVSVYPLSKQLSRLFTCYLILQGCLACNAPLRV